MFDLTGKVAVVTGASRGLGRQDALTLARQGADVVITDVLVEDDPDLQKTAEAQGSMLAQVAVSQGWVHSNQTAEEIRKMGRKSLAIKMDVTNRDQVREVFKKVRERVRQDRHPDQQRGDARPRGADPEPVATSCGTATSGST